MEKRKWNVIHWDDKYVIDHGVIDDDHKYLIGLSNEFILMKGQFKTKNQALDLLDRLQDYALAHFRREEDLQKRIEFPIATEHKLAHAELECSLAQMKNMIRSC